MNWADYLTQFFSSKGSWDHKRWARPFLHLVDLRDSRGCRDTRTIGHTRRPGRRRVTFGLGLFEGGLPRHRREIRGAGAQEILVGKVPS